MRRFANKAKRRRQTKPENSSWFAVTPVQGSEDELQLVALSGGATPSTYLTINPMLEYQELFQSADPRGSIMGPSVVKLMRFDGKLRLIYPKVWGDRDSAWHHKPLFVYYAWRRVTSNAQSLVSSAATFDPMATGDNGAESWRAMTYRGPEAPQRWGTVIIQPDYRPSAGRLIQNRNGDATMIAEPWAAELDGEFHQRLVEVTIPFPRLPKGGLRLARNETLRLEMIVRRFSTPNHTSGPEVNLGTEPSDSQWLYMLPFFRYLVSYDD